LPFEAGSGVVTFGGSGFQGCLSLKSICVPVSPRHAPGLVMADSRLESVVIDAENRFSHVSGCFVVDLSGICVVYSFGHFEGYRRHLNRMPGLLPAMSSVALSNNCAFSILGNSVFEQRRSLRSISLPLSIELVCIPSSAETISQICFGNCTKLWRLTFERRVTDLNLA
jgi:hypothetical protein